MANKPTKVPCVTCPYRRDVLPGIWESVEYYKLIAYDAETFSQPTKLFMCHQQSNYLCGGWLLTHDMHQNLALRVHYNNIDPSVWSYTSKVKVFSSGAEAAAHGISGIKNPSLAAQRKISYLLARRMKRFKSTPE